MIDFPFVPPQASTIAPQVDLLMLALIGLSGFFTAIVVLLIILFGVKYRRGRRVDRSNPPTTSLRIELGWIFSLLILGLGTYTWATILYFDMASPPEDTLDIYVVGQQWMWKIQHPSGPREINELHIPVNQPIRLVMISEDVIHSFYLPAFRIKYDVLPGRYTNLSFTATQVGEFPLYCAEYCGTLHSRMIGRVIVMEAREYQAWLGGTQEGEPTTQAGQRLYNELGCSSCHAPDSGVPAPVLAGLLDRPVLLESGETIIADESYIRASILNPQAHIVAGYPPIMPSYEGRITEEQLLQLVSYITSFSEGNPGETPTEDGAANPSPERVEPTQ